MTSIEGIPLPFTAPAPKQTALMDAAKDLEAAFLAEMLKFSGLGMTPTDFGGGPGEDQFASFLHAAQAEVMVDAGGIGLAESLYEALFERQAHEG